MAGPPNVPLHAVMMQFINGGVVSRCIALMADLGIADQLKDGPKDSAALATAVGVDARALYRVMRGLAGLGVFIEQPDGGFRNSPTSELLRSDVQGSVRAIARWQGHKMPLRIISDLDYSVRTGKPALLKDNPDKNPFQVLMEDPSAQAVFTEAMTGMSMADGAAIVRAYDFSPFRRIIDVGGGQGYVAMMIARAAPHASVAVYDLPHVVKQDLDRVEAIGGNFLEKVPGPADLIVLKWILHDWDDNSARRILSNCRAALNEGGKMLVCEMLITAGPESITPRILDIMMLAGTGGLERTEAEYSALFQSAGLKLDRVIATPTPIRLLEVSAA